MKVYSRFNLPPKRKVGGGIDKCDGSFKDECDINNIVKRYASTGLFPMPAAQGFFEDVSEVPLDLMEAEARIAATQRAFMMLPAELRARFNNSYIGLLQFLEDPANAAQARELGLFRKEAPPTPSGGEAPSS